MSATPEGARAETRTRFDVVISGAGPVGLVLGIGLARAGLGVAITAPEHLPDGSGEGPDPVVGDARAYAVGAATWRIITALDLPPALLAAVTPILGMAVCEGRRAGFAPSPGARPLWTSATSAFPGEGGFLGFDGSEQSSGAGPLGFIVEDRVLRSALFVAAREEAGLTFISSARLASLRFSAAGVEITLVDGRVLAATLAIAADGRQSPLREAAGIRTYGMDYRQMALVATVHHTKPHQGIARQIFLPDGPLALLPLAPRSLADHPAGGARSGLVWTMRPALAAAMIKLGEAEFLAELSARIGDTLDPTGLEGARATFPVGLQLAAGLVRPRLALAGDCAHVVHPLAGQGLNLGLRDAAFLLENVIETDRLGLDIGFLENLRAYQRARRADILRHVAVTHGINSLFSNSFPPFQAIRGRGLSLAGASRPVRQFFMREAAGETSCLPALMRGVDLWPRAV